MCVFLYLPLFPYSTYSVVKRCADHKKGCLLGCLAFWLRVSCPFKWNSSESVSVSVSLSFEEDGIAVHCPFYGQMNFRKLRPGLLSDSLGGTRHEARGPKWPEWAARNLVAQDTDIAIDCPAREKGSRPEGCRT